MIHCGGRLILSRACAYCDLLGTSTSQLEDCWWHSNSEGGGIIHSYAFDSSSASFSANPSQSSLFPSSLFSLSHASPDRFPPLLPVSSLLPDGCLLELDSVIAGMTWEGVQRGETVECAEGKTV